MSDFGIILVVLISRDIGDDLRCLEDMLVIFGKFESIMNKLL